MAVVAGVLALSSLGAVGYVEVKSTSDSLSGAARDQTQTMAFQLAAALGGSDQAVANVIPFSPRGLDGIVIIDARGKVTAVAGKLGAVLTRLKPQALAAARAQRAAVQFRVPHTAASSSRIGRLNGWTPDSAIAVSIVPQAGGGVLIAGAHANWAVEKLRTTLYSAALSLAGGVLFIAFGLMLLLGRLVTSPVGRLAAEVRHLGQGNLDAALSSQTTPELDGLASDISKMRDDLLEAVRESSTDPLTGVANHRAFHERLTAATEHTARTGEPLALIAIDLNKLKDINDRFGHVAGDRVISAVATQLANCCSDEHLCARVGGDEFAVICTATARPAAEALAARMCRAVADLPPSTLLGGGGITLSISAGVGDMPGGAATKDALLHQADIELYRSKGARREPVATREAAPPEPSAGGLDRTVRALAVAVDAKDSGTHSHSRTVAGYAVAVGRRLGIDGRGLDSLRRAALLHDVGKIGVPDAIISKPARLTDEEYERMKGHSALGYRILVNGGLPAEEALWVLHHHEHLDGSGYPHALRGDEIPLQSRIMLVADAFEAMTSDRPYRQGRPPGPALEELRRCAGSQFDPEVVEALAAIVEPAAGGEELPEAVFARLLGEGVPS